MPRPDPSSFLPLTRRDVFLAMGAGALSLVLPGCGGGGHGGGSAAEKPVTVLGTVEPGSLASSSGLAVTNVYQASAPVGAAGEFSTIASTGTMIHFVTDASANIVGAALSIPGSAMTVNAESCLQALLFLTPGVLAIDASEASQVIVRLQSQPSYSTALSYLRTNLPTKSLQGLLGDGTFSGLLATCVSDYNASRTSTRGVTVDPARDGLSLGLDTSALSGTKVTLRNAGWRYVRVDRLEKDLEGNVLAHTYPSDVFGTHLVLGATPLSLPSLLARTNGEPAETKDANSLDLSNVATTEYWVQGPGWNVGESLPPQVPSDADFAHLISLFYYAVWPVIQTVFGISTDPLSALSRVESAFYGLLLSFKRYLFQIESVIGSGKSAGEIAQDILESVKGIIELILEREVLVTAGLITEARNALAKAFFEFLSVAFAGANLVILAFEWSGYERVSHLTITSSGTGGVTVQ